MNFHQYLKAASTKSSSASPTKSSSPSCAITRSTSHSNARTGSWPQTSSPSLISRKTPKASSPPATNAFSAHVSPTHNFSGSPIKNVGSPTISPSSPKSLTSRGLAAMPIKSSAFATSHVGSWNTGPAWALPKPTSRTPTAPPNSPNATSPAKWFANSLNFKASSAAYTPAPKANPTMWPTPSTTTIVPSALTTPSPVMSSVVPYRSPTNSIPSSAALP